MIVTIDRAGRIVVPKSFRDRFNLVAGTRLTLEAPGDRLELRKIDTAGPALARRKGILVHHGAGHAAVDVAAFLRAERESRGRRIAREGAG